MLDKSYPSPPAATAHPPGRNHAAAPASALPRDASGPGQAKTRLGPAGSRAGLSSAENPHLVLGARKRKPGLALPGAPSAGALDVGWGLPGGGLPHPPSCRGLPAFYDGPDLQFIPHFLQHRHLPSGSLRGLPSCPFTPTPTLAGRGRDLVGFTIRWGPQEVRGLTECIALPAFPLHS